MKRLLFIAGILLILIFSVAAFVFLPPAPLPVPTTSIAYPSYEAAIKDMASFDTKEADLLRDECKSIVYSTGKKESRSIVIFHGYTNCPKQFAELGERLFKKGYNVIIPRTPGHGHSDRMTDALANVTFEDFSEYIHRSVAIGNTIGDDVTILGLSAGGTFALWAALFEPNADRFIAMAPVAYPRGFDPILRNLVIRYAALMPNEFKWWNDEQKNTLDGPNYAYPRYSSRSMGIVLHMASEVESALHSGTHASKVVGFVINEHDPALLPDKLLEISNLFETSGAKMVRLLFKEKEKLPHDLIDEHNIKEHKEYVYSALLKFIDEVSKES